MTSAPLRASSAAFGVQASIALYGGLQKTRAGAHGQLRPSSVSVKKRGALAVIAILLAVLGPLPTLAADGENPERASPNAEKLLELVS